MANNNTLSSNESIDFPGLLKKCLNHWYLFVISIIVCLGLGYAYLKIKNPVYQVFANVLIKENRGSGGGGTMQSAVMKNFSFGNMFGGGSGVDDELLVISSHTLLKNVARQLDLNILYLEKRFLKTIDSYKNTPVKLSVPTEIGDTLSRVLLFEVKVKRNNHVKVVVKEAGKKIGFAEESGFPIRVATTYGDYVLSTTSYFKTDKNLTMQIYYMGYDAAAEELRRKIVFDLVSKKANMINLSVQDTRIERGKDLLNTILAEFNSQGIKEKNVEAENTARFIDERMRLVYQELHLSEERIETYKKANNLTDIETEARIMLEQNGSFREKMLETETQYSVIKIIEEFLDDPVNRYSLIPFSVGLSDNSAVEAIQKYNDIVLERMRLLNTSSEDNPSVLFLNKQLDATRSNVISTVQNIKEGIKVSLDDLKKQEETFLARIKGMPTQEREFVDIKRQQMIKEELYMFLLLKKEENAMTLAITAPKGQIVDEAYNLNQPLSPKKMQVGVIALLLGIILPLVYMYLKELFRSKFATKEELERLTSVPVLGEICLKKTSDHIVVKEGDTSSISELFRLLRTNIQFVLTGNDEKVIVVTSSISGEGKTFISTNFALSLALMDKKVVLIGLDIRSPKLSRDLKLTNPKGGITNYLANESYTYDDILIKSPFQKNLDIILAGPIPPNPAELLLSKRLDDLFAELRKHYDYIVVDSAPVGMVADTFCLMRVADATIYVCRANYTEKDNIRYLNDLMENKRLKKVSIVLNGTAAKQGYGYGYKSKHDTQL